MLSTRSGRVKAARKLRRRTTRVERGLFLAEGAKALTEALATGGVVEVFATGSASEEYAALRKAAETAGVEWQLADDDAVASLSGAVTPQGIVAVCRFLDVALDSLVDTGHHPLVICADVRDPGNCGAVIRTADAAGASGVVLGGQSVDPYNDKTVRATVGSLWHLPIALHDDPSDAVRRAQAAGLTVLAADGAGETDLFEAEEHRPARRPPRLAVRQRGVGPARGPRGARRPPGRHPPLRPAGPRAGREPQPGRRRGGLPLRLGPARPLRSQPRSASHCSPRRREAWASHASCTSSVSSSTSISPSLLARSSTDGCPSKWAVVKYGVDSSWTSACLAASSGTQNTITSSYFSPVSGSRASGRGVRKKTKDFCPTW